MAVPIDARVAARVPHRAPILRVHDVVTDGAAEVHVRGREPRGDGELPWALGAIEGLAQSAAVLLGHGGVPAAGAPAPAPRGMLVAVKGYRVHGTPPPDAPIDYRVRLVRRLGATVRLQGTASCAGEVFAAGELTLWIGPAAG
jgi:predicted hotdog family 3-hydroxylacyl-ACP dehydratase